MITARSAFIASNLATFTRQTAISRPRTIWATVGIFTSDERLRTHCSWLFRWDYEEEGKRYQRLCCAIITIITGLSTPLRWQSEVFNRRYLVCHHATPPYGYYWPVQSGGRYKDPSRQEFTNSSMSSHMEELSRFPMEVLYSILRHYHDTPTLLQHLMVENRSSMAWFDRYCVVYELELLLVGLLVVRQRSNT